MEKLGEFELNKVYCMDCLEGLKKIPDNSVDFILTDTPYGISFKSGMDSTNRFDYIYNDDNLDFFEPFIVESKRILKENTVICLFCRFDNYPFMFEILKKYGFNIKNCLVWEKNKALGGLGDMEASFISNYEFVILAMKGRRLLFKDRFGRQFGLIKDDSISSPMQLLYPTQKPLKILRKLIKTCSNEGDIVLDAFIGSGSVMVASKECNRKYIGFDINPKAVSIAEERLAQEVLNLTQEVKTFR